MHEMKGLLLNLKYKVHLHFKTMNKISDRINSYSLNQQGDTKHRVNNNIPTHINAEKK